MMKISLFSLLITFFTQIYAQQKPVNLEVDITELQGPLKHIWAWYGYDEPNYTYMQNGKKLLANLAEISPVPVYVRAHNLMTTGDGTPALKWGSTNMYTEDENGNPIYYWNIVDSIFDTYVDLKMRPLVQIGFMPKALSTNPEPYQHEWEPGVPYHKILTGWAYPPNNYDKWHELIYQWVKHCIERYGRDEVETWYWQVWNEPDAGYLQAENRLKTYCKMYDYGADAVLKALPTAKIGGPHTTGGGHEFVRGFINHCINGTNAATGEKGTQLDFIAFHAKGWPQVKDGKVVMKMASQLSNVKNNFAVISSFPEMKNIPVIIGESDPEGCAACGMKTNPENAYRNGTMYSSYTAASIPRILDFAEQYNVNLIGAVNWSFEFENQPWFYGFRSLSTNGINKPVLNVFQMLGMMSGERVKVSGELAYTHESIQSNSVRGRQTDVAAFAATDKEKTTVLLWNYHDVDIQESSATIELTIKGLNVKKATLEHYRIDADHSNAYEVWKEMGSPQQPTPEQIKALEKASELALVEKARKVKFSNGKANITIDLPRQAVSFLQITY